MVIELSEQLEAALKFEASTKGISADTYVRELLERSLAPPSEQLPPVRRPLKTSWGILAKYGPAPSAEEIDANAADMFRNFGEGTDF